MTRNPEQNLRRIGLVVEGQTEYEALPKMLDRLRVLHTTPSCFHGQGVDQPISSLAKDRILPHVRVQLAKGVQKVAVILDAELRATEPPHFRKSLSDQLRRLVRGTEGQAASGKVQVYLCVTKFENWLISDPRGICRSNYVSRDISNTVRCHADQKDALALIRSVFTGGGHYKRAVHGPRLARFVRVEDSSVRQCSRSLKEFIQGVTI